MTAKTAFVLTAVSLAAGVLNYLYQVYAAATLDEAAFGLLSAWLARVTLVSSVATLVQYLSLDASVPSFSRHLSRSGVVALAAIVALVALGANAPPIALGGLAVLATIVLYAMVGQLQARLHLGIVAVSLFATAAMRCALPLVTTFYVAHAACAFAGVLCAALLFAVVSKASPADAPEPKANVAERAEGARRLRLIRPVLLAVTTVLLPQIDVLVLAMIEHPSTLGAYSRVALAARMVFFGGAAILQILLPQQLHAADRGEALPAFMHLVQRWLPVVLVPGALLLAYVASFIVRPTGDERAWLFGVCVSAALLVGITGQIQRFAAHRRIVAAAACLGGVVLIVAGAAVAVPRYDATALTRFVLISLVGETIVLGLAAAAQTIHSRRERRELASRP